MKFDPSRAIAQTLARLYVETMQLHLTDIEFDVVLPIPLPPKRLVSRGFNQSEVIANAIAHCIDVPLSTRSLWRRDGDHRPLATISRAARTARIARAFDASPSLYGKRVLLVDDVITTGATIREAARTLLRSGSRTVTVTALALAGTRIRWE